jgi:hypothetical protein
MKEAQDAQEAQKAAAAVEAERCGDWAGELVDDSSSVLKTVMATPSSTASIPADSIVTSITTYDEAVRQGSLMAADSGSELKTVMLTPSNPEKKPIIKQQSCFALGRKTGINISDQRKIDRLKRMASSPADIKDCPEERKRKAM